MEGLSEPGRCRRRTSEDREPRVPVAEPGRWQSLGGGRPWDMQETVGDRENWWLQERVARCPDAGRRGRPEGH